jgi:DMSO reductase anchor subunit
MANEAYTAGIFLILVIVQTLTGWESARPGGGIALYGMKAVLSIVFGFRVNIL